MRTSGKIISISLLVLVGISAACSKGKADTTAGEKNKKGPLTVKTQQVAKSDMTGEIILVGNIIPNRKAVLTSKIPGKVSKILRRDGDRVEENEVLVKIDPEDIDRGVQQARAALATSYAALSQATIQRETLRLDIERYTELKDRGAISEEQYEKAQAGFKASEQSVKMAEAGVRHAKAIVGDAASFRRATQIRAPFAGEVARLLIEEGERIQTMPPSPIMVLMDYDTVDVECQVTEREVGAISEGMHAIVSLDAFPGSTIEAKVTRVVPVLDAATRSFTIKIRLDNADHRIKPGMMAKVKLEVEYKDIVTVPRDAISINNITGLRRIVEVVDGKAVEREIDMGRSFGERIELLDLGGMAIGSAVIVSGASEIYTGMAVMVVNPEAGK